MPRDHSVASRYKDTCDRDTESDLRLLDVIAACLTTGKPGDVVAAAFDKQEQICLVLAKNGNINSADYATTHAFLSALREAKSWIDLVPFLAVHSNQNFPGPYSHRYRRAKYPDEPPTPEKFLHDLINICVAQSASFELQNNKASLIQYAELFGAADTLRRCSFLGQLTYESHDGESSVLKGRVEKLKRRLDKVCQYARIATLMKLVKRLPNIPFRWVEDNLVGTPDRSFEICKNPMEVVERTLGHSPSAEQSEALLQHHPDLCKNWEQRGRFVTTDIHPELRIVLDLCPPLVSGMHPSRGDVVPLPIGCSKRSCFCCTVWINMFNDITGMGCVTTGRSGKPYDDWALPGTAGEMKLVHGEWQAFDRSVVQRVHWQLEGKLRSLMPTESRGSLDEFAPCDSEKGGFSEGVGYPDILWARSAE
ncbi:hypothetical protein Hypma_007323 [Hypsizygus marmoreus]|uniref:Uncharacterized protein n=1 Tax=Hypsizygus marmoreus TaxID=39966 RepID=A0A369KAD5_HYPMA|nr:hypothetical protein Hypma_007323 [Hypsizygus marmoreus]